MKPRLFAAQTRGTPRHAKWRAVREGVGINEVQNFGKFDVQGPGARDWLDRIMAGRIPAPGRLSLSPMLSHNGKIIGDFTVSCLSEGHFQLTSSYGAQDFHMRWFQQNPPQGDGVMLDNISDRRTGFQIAGPHARDVLQAVTRQDVSDMRFMDVRQLTIGLVTAQVQRVSYTGDLGYEIYVDAMEQRTLWDTLWEAGQTFGMKPFGMRAMMSLRLDRFFGSWMREFSPDYTVGETGLDRFVSWKKNVDFIGRARQRRSVRQGLRASCATSSWRPETQMSWPMSRSGMAGRSWASAPRAGIRTMRGCLSRWGSCQWILSKKASGSRSRSSGKSALPGW
jgi:dimethylglycine dehydrogenase